MTKDVFGNGTKETWRGTMLNECFRRLPKAKLYRKNVRVLYLVGPTDRDSPALMSRGIDRRNLLAVDVDKECISRARENRVNAIQSRVQHLFRAMGPGDVPELILLDLMGGITKSTMQIVLAMLTCTGMTKSTVVMVNLLAGRDPFLQQMPFLKQVAQLVLGGSGASLHRGECFCNMVSRNAIWGDDFDTYKATPFDVLEHMDMWSGGYYSRRTCRTTRLRYDSAVFNWPVDGAVIEAIPVFEDEDYQKSVVAAKRKIAAAKAIRTMRLAGTL